MSNIIAITDLDTGMNLDQAAMDSVSGGKKIIYSSRWTHFKTAKKLVGKVFKRGCWHRKYKICKFYRRTQIAKCCFYKYV